MQELGVNSIREFEIQIKIANGNAHYIINNNSLISANMRNKIIRRYPNVNEEWLKTGKVFIKPTATQTQIKKEISAIN